MVFFMNIGSYKFLHESITLVSIDENDNQDVKTEYSWRKPGRNSQEDKSLS